DLVGRRELIGGGQAQESRRSPEGQVVIADRPADLVASEDGAVRADARTGQSPVGEIQVDVEAHTAEALNSVAVVLVDALVVEVRRGEDARGLDRRVV